MSKYAKRLRRRVIGAGVSLFVAGLLSGCAGGRERVIERPILRGDRGPIITGERFPALAGSPAFNNVAAGSMMPQSGTVVMRGPQPGMIQGQPVVMQGQPIMMQGQPMPGQQMIVQGQPMPPQYMPSAQGMPVYMTGPNGMTYQVPPQGQMQYAGNPYPNGQMPPQGSMQYTTVMEGPGQPGQPGTLPAPTPLSTQTGKPSYDTPTPPPMPQYVPPPTTSNLGAPVSPSYAPSETSGSRIPDGIPPALTNAKHPTGPVLPATAELAGPELKAPPSPAAAYTGPDTRPTVVVTEEDILPAPILSAPRK